MISWEKRRVNSAITMTMKMFVALKMSWFLLFDQLISLASFVMGYAFIFSSS